MLASTPTAPQPTDEAAVTGTTRSPVERRVLLALIALLLLPLAVSAGQLVLDVGDRYVPAADLALIELKVRDVGREPVLTGLYSRDEWSHPGPAQFIALAPFHWLAGGSSIGLLLGALAINAAAVAGMVVAAGRRGGTPLVLVTVLACSLLVRTLGPDFLRDPWNCFVTVLPFGLVVLLAWSMASGDVWALPVAVGVTSFVTQAHVGYVALAFPLLAFGAVGLGVGVLRSGDDRRRAKLLHAGLVAAGVGVVLWLPPLVEGLRESPSNVAEIIDWFRNSEEGAHTAADGWNIVSAQLSALPEWLTWHRTPTWFSGEPPSLYDPPLPWLLPFVVASGVVLSWRRRPGGALVATFVVLVGVSIVAIARTVGPAFDYRLRWTWIVGMLAAVLVAWAGWSALSARWRHAGRLLGPLAVVGIAAVSLANVTAALGAGTPYSGDSDVVSTLMPDVLEGLAGVDGEVLVTDTLAGSWYARGIVLALERRGFDARVPESRRELFGAHRVTSGAPVAARVHVAVNDELVAPQDAGLERVSEWWSVSQDDLADANARVAALDADLAAGRIEGVAHAEAAFDVNRTLFDRSDAFAYAAAASIDREPSPLPGRR